MPTKYELFWTLLRDTDECIIRPGQPRHRYDGVTIKRRGKLHRFDMHVLACQLRHGRRPPGLEAGHTCGVPACFNPRHLRWITRLQQRADDRALGVKGAGMPPRISNAVAAEIVAASTHRRHRDVAAEYGIHYKTIRKLRLRLLTAAAKAE